MPEVSIILPVYNGAAFVSECVRSIMEQTFNDFELIVVNDGSTDSTQEIVFRYSQQDPRIKLINIEHRGVAIAFNTGIDHAVGKYIARMDADDIMLPHRIEKQVGFLCANPETGVVSSLVKHGGDPDLQQGYALHVNWNNSLLTHETIFLNRFVDSPICNPSVMFRKELYKLHGGAQQGDFPEDYEMWLRWMENGVQFGKVPEVLTVWNDPPERITRNDSRYSIDAFERAKLPYLILHIRKFSQGRDIFLCGAGRVTRRKSDLLVLSGMQIGGYIDVDPGKASKEYNGIKVYGVNELPDRNSAFVISFISSRGARDEIRRMLSARSYIEGSDFILAG